MNYFAHGRQFLDQPYFLAGTAVPDWLNVVNRRCRVRRRHAIEFVDHAEAVTSAIARGIIQHLDDDDWFHRTRAFAELQLEFTVAIRDHLGGDGSLRAGFLGHILVELLLDDALRAQTPAQLEEYYTTLNQIEPAAVEGAVALMSTKSPTGLARFIEIFRSAEVLYDYADDDRLLYRLNQVMQRVGLEELPPATRSLFPSFRNSVRRRRAELLDASSVETS